MECVICQINIRYEESEKWHTSLTKMRSECKNVGAIKCSPAVIFIETVWYFSYVQKWSTHCIHGALSFCSSVHGCLHKWDCRFRKLARITCCFRIKPVIRRRFPCKDLCVILLFLQNKIIVGINYFRLKM